MTAGEELPGAVEHLMAERGLSQRRACHLVGIRRSSTRYQVHRDGDTGILVRLLSDRSREKLTVVEPTRALRCAV